MGSLHVRKHGIVAEISQFPVKPFDRSGLSGGTGAGVVLSLRPFVIDERQRMAPRCTLKERRMTEADPIGAVAEPPTVDPLIAAEAAELIWYPGDSGAPG
jgi:hypothetical protein